MKQENTYSSLDYLPIWNYWQFNKSQDVKFLHKDPSGKINPNAYSLIEDEVILLNLKDPHYRENLNKIKNSVIYFASKSPAEKLKYQIIEKELNQEVESNTDLWDIVVSLEKSFGINIDPFTCSVNKFYAYIRNGRN